jgi:oligopeptide transport system substrate-binding protein
MKKLLSLVLVAVLALSLVACGNKNTDPVDPVEPEVTSADYRTTYSLHYETLNYLVSQSANDNEYTANMLDGLVEVNYLNQIIPSLGESWEVEMKDGKQVWTFKIKQGVQWQRNDLTEYGAEVKAQDWVTSANYILNPSYASEMVGLLTRFIDGAQNYNCSKLADMNEADGEDAPNCTKADDYVYNTDFSQVGVKALDDYTLEYTLASPAPYFLTALTYNSFYPVNEAFLLETGEEFGKDSNFLLINGAYSITTDEMDTQIQLTKNPNYWAAEKVHINEITYYFASSDITPDFYRLKYESGEIDGFTIREDDTTGWETYVIGPDGTGTPSEPYAPDAISKTTVSPYTYHNILNFNRTAFDGSDLTEAQHAATALAMKNANFRLGLLHGLKRTIFTEQYTPENPSQWIRNIYTPRELAVDQNGRDYVDYVIDVIAEKNGMTWDEANEMYSDGNDAHYDAEKAMMNFEKAKEALLAAGLTEADFPIHFESVATDNSNRLPYYDAYAEAFNAEFGDLVKFVFIYPTTGDEWKSYSNVKLSYDMRINMGWGPDYADPSTYLNTYAINGDMLDYAGLAGDEALQQEVLGEFDALYRTGLNITAEDKIDQRFRKFAESEYTFLYEQAIIIPHLSPRGDQVSVTKLKPYTAATVNYGLQKMKYKYRIVLDEAITKEQRAALKAEYEAAKAK